MMNDRDTPSFYSSLILSSSSSSSSLLLDCHLPEGFSTEVTKAYLEQDLQGNFHVVYFVLFFAIIFGTKFRGMRDKCLSVNIQVHQQISLSKRTTDSCCFVRMSCDEWLELLPLQTPSLTPTSSWKYPKRPGLTLRSTSSTISLEGH